jgi:hypothetical protein
MDTFQHQPPQNHNKPNLQPVAAAEKAPISRSTSHAGSYFPQPSSPNHQPQQQQLSQSYSPQQHQYHLPPVTDDNVTRINTLANTNPHGASLIPVGTRGPKFTEEWDASQRGSSILDGHQGSTMQRSNSYAGSVGTSDAGHHNISLERGNTLKKKSSIVAMRRSGSLRRSGRWRSTKAGSVKSMALQSRNDPDEMHSAFYCPIPTTGNPTEALANRFQGWCSSDASILCLHS